MGSRIPLPRPLAGAPFTVRDARALGVKRGRLRNHDLTRPFHGVRSAEPDDSLEQSTRAYATRMPVEAFFSHGTAARLWGIPLPARLERTTDIDVAVPNRGVVLTGSGVRGHHLMIDQADIAILNGLRVTSLARTWCDLAAQLNDEEVVAIGDFLIWRRRPDRLRLRRSDLADALRRFRGRRGRPVLRFALPFLSDRADSPPESAFRLRFAKADLPRPEVNIELYSRTGFLAMPDLCFPEYKVSFDYEGDHHRTDPVQWEKDIARVRRLEDAGWLHVRASKADLRHPHRVIDHVSRRLRARGWPSPSP